MKKEFGFIDSDGNISNDENRFIQEYADFWKKHPEKLERLNELKRRNKKYEDLQYKPFEGLEFALQHGEFKQACEFWFRSELKEIESKGNDKNYFEFLTGRKKALKMLIPKIKKEINLYPEIKENFEFWILSIEDLQNMIDVYLNALETSKPKNNNIYNGHTPTILKSFNLKGVNSLLFDKSDLNQWESVFNAKKLNRPIKLKEGVTLKDLRYFIDELSDKFSFNKQRFKLLETIEAFSFNGKTVSQSQYIDAKKDIKNAIAPLKNEIDNLINQ